MKDKPSRLESLRKKMQKADLPLKKTANNLVFGQGSPDAEIFFIGEAPGNKEDLQGLPFVGMAGRVLNELLQGADLQRDDAYITSILKYRPPNNRNPSMKEIIAHTPYLIEQIQIIEPKILATLGNFATRFVLSEFKIEEMGTIPGISQLHGKARTVRFKKHTFTVIPLYHPAASLYNQSLRKTLHKDFKNIKNTILKQGPDHD